jgi:hypothetical protein
MTACEWCDADEDAQCDRDCDCPDCESQRALDDDADAYADRCQP